MTQILLLGAGRSAPYAIEYLAQAAQREGWRLCVADRDETLLAQRQQQYPGILTQTLDLNADTLANALSPASIVVSLLPPDAHVSVAAQCVMQGKHFLSASYVSEGMQALHAEAVAKGVLLLNEIGLDPGIDHMSAMQLLDHIRQQGGHITAFYSYTGGLIAPQSVDNPWHYKFTWNPRNVVLAGQGGPARFRHQGLVKYLPYSSLFEYTQPIEVAGWGSFDGYANRDSLQYSELYGLQTADTLIRGTLRRRGFCQAWQVLLRTGLTDDTWQANYSPEQTYGEWLERFIHEGSPQEPLLTRWARQAEASPEAMEAVAWLGLHQNHPLGLSQGSPAQVLQQRLETLWQLHPEDLDLVVMQHKVVYQLQGQTWQQLSDFCLVGEPSPRTAMAKTVGLPLAMAAVRCLKGEFSIRGVQRPLQPEVYQPLLAELATQGIHFEEQPPQLLGFA
ncbi:saccharopine dehydrogenase C-terminal domain-containing protein [Eisenibacter elegans]|jgi:saccharopine dehydrogenase-like NADP-dependent oxidoreductase|uniref:saccharopine dehydrogenase C-terminal domain-containing protein n=1 Tax=Eisenibacter elegans TaxID=997 RepID=UPI0004144811|nr:saccharopine dehydrogenase C-terminal domain-containing protein [Eisenibacter elegans]